MHAILAEARDIYITLRLLYYAITPPMDPPPGDDLSK